MVEGGFTDWRGRVNGVLERLKDCFGELQGIMRDGSSDEERSDVVSTVWEMLGALETGLKRVPEKQQDDGVQSKRMRSDPGICTHTCVHHLEIVDPGLWSKLPEDLVGRVFARLPIPRIVELRKSSVGWSAISDSASFKGAFAEANPKLFGLLGLDRDSENFRTRILDATFTEWQAIDLDFLKANGYIASFLRRNMPKDAMYACDGGLVCFVPEWEEYEFEDEEEDDGCANCVFVCNPLTNVWRELPALWKCFPYQDLVMVQLVTNELSYRVVLVYRHGARRCGAYVYDSGGGSWSTMSSGLVYGTGSSLHDNDQTKPMVFDCATNRLINLGRCTALRDLKGRRYSIYRDRLFVLHALIDLNLQGDEVERCAVSEFTWESSRSDLSRLNDYDVGRYDALAATDGAHIYTSNGLILSTWDNQLEYGNAHQVIRIYDICTGHWRDLPPLIGDVGIRNGSLFMCELRWDAKP